MLRGFFGNLIFAIIARMLCGNRLKYFILYSLLTAKKKTIIMSLRYNSSVLTAACPANAATVCKCINQIIFIFFAVFSIFESEGITKHLMTGPRETVSFASPRGTLSVSGKQNSLFPLGPVIKCLLLFMVFSFSDCCLFFVHVE